MGRVRPLDFEVVRDELTFVEAVCQRDRQRRDFCAEVGTAVVRAERASDLLRKLRDELRRGLGLRWTRAVVLEVPPKPKFYARSVAREGFFVQTAFSVARGEVATRSDGALLFRGWPPEEFDEDLPEGLNLPDERIVSVLPANVLVQVYSEAIWRTTLSAALVLARAGEAIEGAGDFEAFRRATDLKALLKEVADASKPSKID